ncbi:MAG: hypothetical protein M9899_08205 [Bdellovibrionaceae bacterium]|nr:hypothetical protein [Pseudobdellovibrionaceae bacterium]
MTKALSFFCILLLPVMSWAYFIPSNLTSSEQKFVAGFLSQTYSAQYMSRPFYTGNDLGIEFGTSFQYRPLDQVKERFTADDINSSLFLSSLYINKSLIYGLELGLSMLLSSFTSDTVSGFGGHLRWYPDIFANRKFQAVLQLYTQYTNFRDAFYNQDLGFHMGLGYNRRDFSVYLGGDFAFAFSSFSAISDARPITSSGRREEVDHANFSPFLSLQYHFDSFHINVIQSYNFNASWSSRLNLSYSL